MSSHHIPRPTAKDVLRYRRHSGVLLDGIFVFDRKQQPGLFDAGAAGPTELDAVVASILVADLDATRAKWEAHWTTSISDAVLQQFAARDITTLHIPISYYTLGPAFCEHTPFAMQPAQVYVHAWQILKCIIARTAAHGMGVILDLAVLPGCMQYAQQSAHVDIGRMTLSDESDSWQNDIYLSLTRQCLSFLDSEVSTCPELTGVIGYALHDRDLMESLGELMPLSMFRTNLERQIQEPTSPASPDSEAHARLDKAEATRSKAMFSAIRAHTNHTQSNAAPGTRFEHWRFADGWHLGWTDARDFFRARQDGLLGACSNRGDKIGLVEPWIHKRIQDEKIEGVEFEWEWVAGMRQGLEDFYKMADVEWP